MEPKIVEYRIIKILHPEYLLTEKEEDYTITPEDCEINLKMGLRVDNKAETVIANIEIEFIDKRDQQLLMLFKTSSHFKVINFTEALAVKENVSVVNLPDNFVLDVIQLSLGATRGMLVIKNAGTYLAHIILPAFQAIQLLEAMRNSIAQKPQVR
jgi:hypothetical protein